MVNKTPKISIVVPIYNVEKYLEQCIESLVEQTLKNIEIILINDGSSDRSGDVIEKFAKNDKRIRTISRENKGYSYTVNEGIELAKGEYIGIIESDDWVESDMFEQLYKNAKENDADVTKGLFCNYDSTREESDSPYPTPGVDFYKAPEKVFSLEEWPYVIAGHSSIWSAIYRADFVKRIKLAETKGASYQDLPFMIETMAKANRITIVKKVFVHWRNEQKQNNSTSARGEKLFYMLKNTRTGLRILKDSGKYQNNSVKNVYLMQVFFTNMSFFLKIQREYKPRYYKEMRGIVREIVADGGDLSALRKSDRLAARILLKTRSWHAFWLGLAAGGAIRKMSRLFLK